MEEAYFNLIRAIIERAQKDYRDALKNLAMNPNNFHAQDRIKEVESFYRSDWFVMLTGHEGDGLIERLR